MSGAVADFIHGQAELGSESDDEDFDEETGEARPRASNGVNGGRFEDSSEEDEEDDEEEAERIRTDFIVEDDEDEGERRQRRKESKKRRRREREEEEAGLDEDDFDLVAEANPELARAAPVEPRLKRLKRGHRPEREERGPRGAGDLFDSDDEDDVAGDAARAGGRRREAGGPLGRMVEGEFDDFIEQDSDAEGEGQQAADDAEVSRFVGRGLGAIRGTGLDEAAVEDFKEAFGDGAEYDWALALQEQQDAAAAGDPAAAAAAAAATAANAERRGSGEGGADEADHPTTTAGPHARTITLKDVFEPSQLAERMMTDEDNRIRTVDVPERFQVARAPYRELVFTDEQKEEEAAWVAKLMLDKRRSLSAKLEQPFRDAVAQVLEYMNKDLFEVPFIFQHRKDYLIHASTVPASPDPDRPDEPQFTTRADKLLTQADLWEIFDLDLKFRALVQKRNALERTYASLKEAGDLQDTIFEELLPKAEVMEELQDLQDYLYFQYPSRLADAALLDATATENGTAKARSHKRPGATRALFDKIRQSKVYSLVRAFGISADDFAQNAQGGEGRRHYTDDPAEAPEALAARPDVLDPPAFATAAQCLDAARALFAEELALNPRLRAVLRRAYYGTACVDVWRTEKGMRRIDPEHPYYEFKYLRNQSLRDIAVAPGLYLRMLRAEEEGLVEVRVRLADERRFVADLYGDIESDNFSENASAWNAERRRVVDRALAKLHPAMQRSVKENLRAQCESEVALACRERFSARLDQAPYRPKGEEAGAVSRVLALSNGAGTVGRDPVYWAFVEDNGSVRENGRFADLSLGDPDRGTPDGADLAALVELVRRRKPDVLGVSGFVADTRKLANLLRDIVERKELRGADGDEYDGELLEVLIVNDEVARLYQTSARAHREYPALAPLTRYCVALARYLQNPLLEYAALGRDLIALAFDPDQRYASPERVQRALDSTLVDYVNLVGVEVNEAAADPATANLLPYVAGLGPRKAQHLLKMVHRNGGAVLSRNDLLTGDPARDMLPAISPAVYMNAASFLYLEAGAEGAAATAGGEAELLDGTRIHPEDYDLARKMAADALELDEEDVAAEVAEHGPGAVVRKLVRGDESDKVNDLVLDEYAEQIQAQLRWRKRATLESIRAELQAAYEELRRLFETERAPLDVFTMLTGETADSLREGQVVPVRVRRVTDDAVECRLDCGVEGTAAAHEVLSDPGGALTLRQAVQPHTTVQAKILGLNRKRFTAELSLRPDEIARPVPRWDPAERLSPDEWDAAQETQDRRRMERESAAAAMGGGGLGGGGLGGGGASALGSAAGGALLPLHAPRVVKHPLFRPFGAAQAHEYLQAKGRGDAVVRPSSLGPDHLAVTWKVAPGLFQHLDVLELDNKAGGGAGKTLRVSGRWNYVDLDELLVNHVQSMARKIDEMVAHEKYQNGSKEETEKWLTTYTEANPRRAMYAFCLDRAHPGYFHLCFKPGRLARLQAWPVKVIPAAFELQKVQYADMKHLCNGFKILFSNMQSMRASGGGGGAGGVGGGR